jgi:hypothetical protein
VIFRVAAVERVLRALPEDARRRHVAAGLAEHAVVQQDAGDLLAPCRRVEYLLETLVHHVAVALEREHHRIGPHALHARRHRRCPPVQGLDEIDVDRARERRVTADARDHDRTLREAELLERLEVHAQRERLAAARAHVVLLGEQQVGLEVGDLLGVIRWLARVEHRTHRTDGIVGFSRHRRVLPSPALVHR